MGAIIERKVKASAVDAFLDEMFKIEGDFSRETVLCACFVMACLTQEKELRGDQIAEAAKGLSEWLGMYLLSLSDDGTPKELMN